MNVPALKALAKHLPSYKQTNLGGMKFLLAGEAVNPILVAHYSILGVLCDVYKRAKKEGEWAEVNPNNKGNSAIRFLLHGEPWVISIPPEVMEWYGLNELQVNNFWLLQADGYDFRQIAKAIEKMIERETK